MINFEVRKIEGKYGYRLLTVANDRLLDENKMNIDRGGIIIGPLSKENFNSLELINIEWYSVIRCYCAF